MSACAYVIASVKIRDRARYAAYEQRFMGVLAPFGGEVLAVDDAPRALEGEWQGARTVVLRFPDEVTARRWYDSAAYQEIALDRKAASTAEMVIVSGLEFRK